MDPLEDADTKPIELDLEPAAMLRVQLRRQYARFIVKARRGDKMMRFELRRILNAIGKPHLYGLVVPGGRDPQPDDAVTQRLVDAIFEHAAQLDVTVQVIG